MEKRNDFDQLDYQEKSLVREVWDFLKVRKKFWLLPLLLALALLALFIILGGTAAAPFIYPLI